MLVVGADYALTDSMNVHGGYKQVSADWKPSYIADKAKAKDDKGQNWVHEGTAETVVSTLVSKLNCWCS